MDTSSRATTSMVKRSDRINNKGNSLLPTSGASTSAAAAGSQETDRVVVEGEQHKSKSKTKTPPQSKINKQGWNFKKYNRGSSGTNHLASLSVLSSPQLLLPARLC